MEHSLKIITERIVKAFPKNTDFIIFHNVHQMYRGKLIENYKLWIPTHTFKITVTSDSNECDSIEGFINHLNYEFEGMPGWKPIPQTAKGKRELNLLNNS